MSEIIIAALVIMAVSLIGVLFTQKTAGDWLNRNLGKLTSFAAGVFVITALLLALEVLHLMKSAALGIGLIIAGYGVAWTMHFFIPESHHRHDNDCSKSAKKLIVGDAIHNIGDGIILVPAFMVSSTIGWTVTISIIIHEAIQEISEFFVLRRAGYSAEKALRINLAVSSTIFIGVVIGSLAFATINLEGILLALTAGFFLHVVIHDLLPLRQDSNKRTTLWNHVGLIAVGAGLMLGAHSTLRDVHVHGDDHTDVHTQEKNHATTVIPEPEAEHVDHDH